MTDPINFCEGKKKEEKGKRGKQTQMLHCTNDYELKCQKEGEKKTRKRSVSRTILRGST